ncbi:MAG: hypothetical protein LBC71_04045 [Oscillospiraceae bacterium]|jgi:hypothetical protein|nr:hypothetical protein [Oscillospiraceae bacterium]
MNLQTGILALDNEETKNAFLYFDVLSELKETQNNTKFTGINKYGIVELVGMTNKAAARADETNDLNSVLESLSNILISAVLKHAGSDEKAQVDPKHWLAGYNALVSLFCHNYSSNTKDYRDKKVGKEVVQKVIEIGFDVNGEPSNLMKEAISKYLQQQAELMNNMGFDGTLDNPYTLIGFSNFIYNNKRVCCFRAYFTKFDTNSVKVTRSCKSAQQKFDFNFTITHCNADFMLSNWENNPAFKQKVNDFIDKHQAGDHPFFDECQTAHKFTVV